MRAAFVSVSLFFSLISLAHAEIVEFSVDPAQTRWSVRGGYFPGGITQAELEPQSPGSMVTSLAGIIRVDLTPTTIQFLPTSVLDAVLQPLPQQPGLNGAVGTAPADYGMAAVALQPRPLFAVRDFRFSLTSPVLLLGPAGDQFRQDIDAIVNTRIDYNLVTSQGAYSLTNWSRGFDDDNAGNLTTQGLTQTLEFQNYFGDIFALQAPSDSFFEWSGPIVATRIIPEPVTLALAAMFCAIGFIACRPATVRFDRAVRATIPISIATILFAGLALSTAHGAAFYFLGDSNTAGGISPDGSKVLVNADSHNFSIWEAGEITPILSGEIWPRDITNNSEVIGLHCGNGTGSCYEAFRWTSAGGLVGLGGGSSSDAEGISADGSVVVGTSFSGTASTAYRWTSQTGIVPLGNLGGHPDSQEIANGVSADGTIAVGQSGSPAGPQAFRWTQATGMVGLGDLPGWRLLQRCTRYLQ